MISEETSAYLQDCVNKGSVSEEIARSAKRTLIIMKELLGDIPEPDMCPSDDGNAFIMAWDNGRFHLSVDILANGDAEICGIDRKGEY